MNKRTDRRAVLHGKRVALAVAAAFLPCGEAYSLPAGEDVVAGTVTVTRPTAETMQINQATQKGIVNWQGFSIGATEHVNISQPNSSAALLNRVVGNDPSQIFGRLTANGQVFLVNNAGVLFAPGASVEVGSLFASTLSITDQNFLNGTYQFYNPGNAGSVVNQGNIVTPNGYTALVGPQVRNDGVIVARSGTVALTAADRVTLDMIGDGLISVSVDQAAFNASVINTGTIEADGGTVALTARSANALLDTVINTSGVLRANALVERNGEIVLDGGNAGTVQVAGLVQAGGNIDISAGGALNVGSTVCCFGTTIIGASQDISAGSITVGGGAQITTTPGTGSQTISTPGTLLVRGGVLSGNVGIFHNGSGAQTISAGDIVVRGGSGSNTAALISSQGPGEQFINASRIDLQGGSVGSNNAVFIRADSADQHINVSGDINIAAGAAGDAWLLGSANGQQTIFAQNINMTNALGGNNSFGAIQGGHQEIHATGDVRLTGGTTGGTNGGLRIGGVRFGTTVTATDLELYVGGDLVLTGGNAANNAAIVGSTGSAAVANDIYIETGGSVIMNSGTASGARIGAGPNTLAGGNIDIRAGGAIALNGTAQSTAIRTLGNVTLDAASISEASNGFILANTLTTTSTGNTNLAGPNEIARFSGTSGGSLTLVDAGALQVAGITTTNDAITLTTDSLTNAGAISNGGGASNANMILNADTFNLAGGAISVGSAGVILRPRTGTNSFGIESAGATTLTNADIASIDTSNFVVFGSGMGTTFTGNMTIGENAQVNGGTKSLAFFRSASPGGTTSIGAHGVTTSGDVIVSAGGGAIVSNGGTVAGDEVQLRASQGIGTPGTRVQTSANALAINNTGLAGAFVSEADDVTLRSVVLNVGGIVNGVSNFSATTFDLATGGGLDVTGTVVSGPMNIDAAGALRVIAGTTQDASLLANGAQTIRAGSIDIRAQAAGRLAEIRGNSPLGQTITSANHIRLGDHAAQGRSSIFSGGNQTIAAGADLTLIGGSGLVADQSNATIIAGNSAGVQTINAGSISLANSMLGGNNSVAAILGASQLINTTGNATLTANASGGTLPGVRIGGLSGAGATPTNLTLNVGGDLVLTGGTLAGNGVGIGSTASASAPALANNITIDAQGSVILNSRDGGGARIGSSATTGTAPGNITITAGGGIELNGAVQGTAIRTLDTVTLHADHISEAANGFIVAGSLSTTTSGNTTLTGPNEVSKFSASSVMGDVILNNTVPLAVTNLTAAGNASLTSSGDVTVSGFWNARNTAITTTGPGSDLAVTGSDVFTSFGQMDVNVAGDFTVNRFVTSFGPMHLDVDGVLKVDPIGVQDASLTSFGGQDINARAIEVVSRADMFGAGRFGSIGNNNAGDQRITVSGGGINVDSLSGNGFALITNGGPGNQTITVSDGSGVRVRALSTAGGAQINNFGSGSQSIAVSGGGGLEVKSANAGTGSATINNGGTGNQTIAVSGGTGLDVVSEGSFATIGNFGGGDQIITIAGSGVEVRSSSGGDASISNHQFGSQLITVSGGTGIDVQSGGRSAGIGQAAFGAPQTISVTNADHLVLNATDDPINFIGVRSAFISTNGGVQTISVTGNGANAIALGSAGALGFSQIAGSTQSVVAGLPGEGGSITITGPAANNTAASIVSRPSDGRQTVSTSGLISITGGTALNQNFPSGIFHNGSGEQTITAAGISLTGGPGGRGNTAQIGSFGGGVPANAGNQVISVADGTITLRGSDGGTNNRASIFSNADQTINGDPNLVLIGGGSAIANTGSATIQTALGRSQTIHAGTITLTNSANANADSFAGIISSHQLITTTGDVVMSPGASPVNGGSARIGGQGGGGTDLHLTVGGNLIMNGGDTPAGGVGIGSSGAGTAFANNIDIAATGDVILNSGVNGARIGSARATGTAGGNISISGRSIQLNGTGSSAAIRTLDNVTLHADQPGGTISENGNGFILAGSLTTTSHGNTSLIGHDPITNMASNRVANFSASSTGGDVTLKNDVAVLNVGNLNAANATVNNSGNVVLSGAWNSAAADITASGPGASISEVGGGFIQAASLSTNSSGSTSLGGPNQVAMFSGTSGADLTLNSTAALLVTGVNASAGTATLTTAGTMAISGPVAAQGVVLTAGGAIDEAGAGSIAAHSLTTTSGGDTTLNGANQVATFNANSGGDVSLNNTGVLNVTGLIAAGDANITNIGDVNVSGPWTAGGTSSITVGSDILLNAAMVSADVVLTANDGAIIQSPTGSITADTLNTTSSGQTLLVGANQVESFSATSSGELAFNNASPTLTISNINTNGGAFSLTHIGDLNVTDTMAFATVNIGVSGSLAVLAGASPAEISAQGPINISVGNDLRVMGGSGDGAFARIHGYSDINLTVGGFLTINAGSGADAWARIQTASRDSVINLHFPNLASGGYFVNGVEGLLRDGKTGLLSENGVAAPDHQLVITYGEQ